MSRVLTESMLTERNNVNNENFNDKIQLVSYNSPFLTNRKEVQIK